jgi:hypothetical protein
VPTVHKDTCDCGRHVRSPEIAETARVWSEDRAAMASEIKERRRGAWLGSSDRRRDAEIGRRGKRGTKDPGGFGYRPP